jgi:GTPase SAR1 family protein
MTNTYRDQYRVRKETVLSYLGDSIEALQNWGENEAASPLEKLKGNVEEDRFSIVLVGEFSAGKSTFLNALMHQRVLPSFTNETTATVNFLRHRSLAPEGVLGQVYYRNGSIEDLHDLDIPTIERVVSTRGGDDEQYVANMVDHVDLFLDSAFLQDGVMLVDSPGLNGVADRHREITEQQIKASHASIFVFNADQPGSKTNFEYLRQLKSESDNIFFVLNKIDVIRSSENQTVEDVVEQLRQTYHKQFPEESELPKIWPVAAYPALAARDHDIKEDHHHNPITSQEQRDKLEEFSRMGAFEDRLWQYLTQGERAHDQLYEPVQNAMAALSIARNHFDQQVKILQDEENEEDVQKKREVLEAALAELKKNRSSESAQINKRVQTVMRDLKESAENQCADLCNSISHRMQEFETPEEFQTLAEALPREIQTKCNKIARKLDEDLREELLLVVSEEYGEYVEAIESTFDEANGGSGFQFTPREVIISDATIGVQLSQFDSECKALREEINKHEEAAYENEKNAVTARQNERDLQEKKDRLRDLEESRNYIEEKMFVPDVEYHQESRVEKEKREGVVGFFGNIFLGPKEVQRLVTVKDASAHDEALERKERKLSALDEEIKGAKEELSAQKTMQRHSDMFDADVKYHEARVKKLEEELRQKQEEFKSELKRKAEKACRRMRSEIEMTVDSIVGDVKAEILKYIRGHQKKSVLAVQELLNASIDTEISSKQKMLDDLLTLSQTQGAERKKKLEAAQAGQACAVSLLAKGADISSMLDSTMKDKVEKEAL